MAKEELQNIPQLNGEMHVVYYPQLGCEICIPRDESVDINEQLVDELEYQFHTSTKIYFKNARMHELDHHLGYIYNGFSIKPFPDSLQI